MTQIDYQSIYTEYWSRPDRWGSSSFRDSDDLVQRILSSCGGGKVLDVGCGMGHLVRTFLRKGIDAWGIDVAHNTIDYCNNITPGRFTSGSMLHIPHQDNSFETVVTTDVLEHLTEIDIPKAISELVRVARRYIYVVLSTAPDRDKIWHLTMQNRNWWEKRFFLAGCRKHPLIQTVLNYTTLENEPDQITLIFEKIPADINEKYSLESLNSVRQLHMDMLRETGRRSDAHIARYNLACVFVRPNDVVLDVACGLGYGSAILAAGSSASKVIGVDNSLFAIKYAQGNYAHHVLGIEFHENDASCLSFLDAESVDYIVSFETLEHVPDTKAFLSEAYRVLKPSGRIILSVPNDWTDETGKDPNPHHLHVYTWCSVCEEIASFFRIEKAYAQIAGGALKLKDGKRALKEVSVVPEQDEPAEWWLMLAMKDPLAADRLNYRETSFPDYSSQPAYNITAFGRDYDNPWLVKGMVSIGMRMTSIVELQAMAEAVLSNGRPGSADVGAAICVRAYQVLQQAETTSEQIQHILDQISTYHSQADDNPNAWRWRISNQYVAAHLLLKMGDHGKAQEAFKFCGEMDFLNFSPLIATKTVDAWFHAGILAANTNNFDKAKGYWIQAVKEAERAAHSDWLNVLGDPKKPVIFGLRELSQLLDLASRAANALLVLDNWSLRPGWSWNQSFKSNSQNLEYWRHVAETRLIWIEQINQHLDFHVKRLSECDQQLCIHAQILSERDQQLNIHTQLLNERDQQVSIHAQQLSEREQQLAIHIQLLHDRDKRIHDLLNSYSWKITKPLRYILTLFKNILK